MEMKLLFQSTESYIWDLMVLFPWIQGSGVQGETSSCASKVKLATHMSGGSDFTYRILKVWLGSVHNPSQVAKLHMREAYEAPNLRAMAG